MTARIRFSIALFVFLGAVLAFAAPVRRPVVRAVELPPPHDWPQFDLDAEHSGSPSDALITPQNVAALQPLFHASLPGVSDGAPAYWTAGSSRRADHVLFFTATSGALFALRADGQLLWQTTPPDGPRWTTSSPVLDPSREFVYSYALDGRVHKYAIRTGEEVVDGVWPVLVTHKPDVEKGSSALSVATTRSGVSYLYAAIAGYPDPGDAGDYQGHVVAIRLDTGAATTFNALCSNRTDVLGYGDCADLRAGIWSRAGVTYDASVDRVYVITCNGAYDGKTSWGDSVLKLPPDLVVPNGKPLDSYTPDEYDDLDQLDLDLGSSGLAIAGKYAVQSGKDGIVRLLNLGNLSGQHAAGSTGGELARIPLPQGGEVLTAPATWIDKTTGRSWVFIANDNGTSGFEIAGNGSTPQLVARWTVAEGSRSSPVVSNGVLFAAHNGRIFALDAATGNELWADTSIGNIHWESPIVTGGEVYISDFSGVVWAWTLPPEIIRR